MADKILQILPGAQKNIPLRDFTTYRIGGPAKYFFIAKTKEDLIAAAKAAKSLKLPIFILGGGSNLLISDKGFKGLVIKIDIYDVKLRDNKAVVGAGSSLTKLAYLLADNGLSGLEWAAGVPGTVGGAIYGNAQAFGTKICDAIESVEAVNIKTMELENFTEKQCLFSLKSSIFKKNTPRGTGKNLVIVSAILNFRKEDKATIKNKIEEFINYRKTNHPIDFPSAGSTFVNPEIKIKDKKMLEKYPELKGYNEKGIIPAGYLIAKAGLSGKKIGNAQISEKHSNFIINLGGAGAKDVSSLINLAQERVKNNFGILLVPEVQFVGF